MAEIPGAPGSSTSLVQRIKSLIMKPLETWPAIAAERDTPGDLFVRLAVPLAAIGPVGQFLHGQLFGYGALGISYSPSLVGGIATMVVSYLLALVSVVVLGLVADWLAPKFEGEASRAAAFKLVIWSMTAAWLAGIFQLVPWFGLLGIVGLYSLYLLYTGVTPLLKVPQAKAAGFTAVTVLAGIVFMLVTAPVTAAVTGLFGLAGSTIGSDDEVKIKLPGGGTIDTGKIEEASKQAEAMANGEIKAASPAQLQALLPASLSGYQRTAVESSAMGQMGSTAEGTYTSGDKTITLKIVDMAGMGALAGIGAALGVEENKETADGYERTGTVDGQMQSEKWDRREGSGSFGRVVANRFMVEAEGEAGSIDELKAAVGAVDQSALAGLGK